MSSGYEWSSFEAKQNGSVIAEVGILVQSWNESNGYGGDCWLLQGQIIAGTFDDTCITKLTRVTLILWEVGSENEIY